MVTTRIEGRERACSKGVRRRKVSELIERLGPGKGARRRPPYPMPISHHPPTTSHCGGGGGYCPPPPLPFLFSATQLRAARQHHLTTITTVHRPPPTMAGSRRQSMGAMLKTGTLYHYHHHHHHHSRNQSRYQRQPSPLITRHSSLVAHPNGSPCTTRHDTTRRTTHDRRE